MGVNKINKKPCECTIYCHAVEQHRSSVNLSWQPVAPDKAANAFRPVSHIADPNPPHLSASQPALGSHRVWAAEVVFVVLTAGDATLDKVVASCDLVPRVAALAFGSPTCNSIHSRLLAIVKRCLKSKARLGPASLLLWLLRASAAASLLLNTLRPCL